MTQPEVLPRSKRSLFRPKGPFACLLVWLHLIPHPRASPGGVDLPPPTPSVPDQSEPFPWEADQSSPIDPGTALRERLLGLVRRLRPLLPSGCVLEPGAFEVAGNHPIDAGGSADIWEAMMGDRKVAIKSLRYSSSSSSDYSKICTRFCNEVLACSRLTHPNIVPFIGVYSTPEHPLGLVFDYMEHQNLREYSRNNKDIGRRELLLDVARGVEYMHNLNIVHGNLKITNILVDTSGRARVAGLGAAVLPSAIPGVDIDRFFHGAAPELVDPQRFGLTDTGATKDSDMYAFGVLAWETFGEQAPFSDEGRIAGIYSMLSGRRPPRPEHLELSDSVWGMIEGCWKSVPSQRGTITDAIAVLDAEINPK